MNSTNANLAVENWGTTPFTEHASAWYWGHGRLGPYSVVWFDTVTPTGEEYVSAYVSKDGEIVYAHNSNLTVRPTGAITTFPPVVGDEPAGLAIQIDMGYQGIMEINMTNHLVSQQGDFYARSTGQMTGGIRGQANYTGTGLFEQLTLTS
jgi:hypothetical protein